ncbi:MAG: VRR-NUC domain-containing protein [Actinobacteria bacterium]|nr:VRR-NUC domain-containing protein [Actinomycetota bacterium]
MISVPTEDAEQQALVQYMQIRGIPHFRVPSETYTKSWSQKAKNKRLGVVKGVPDLFAIVNGKLIAIEMKRVKGSVTSPEQKKWIDLLNTAGTPARVCKGATEAIAFINEIKA